MTIDKQFVCGRCRNTYQAIKGIQPVPVTPWGGHICQHCWSTLQWGKEWADKGMASDPRRAPVNRELAGAGLRDGNGRSVEEP